MYDRNANCVRYRDTVPAGVGKFSFVHIDACMTGMQIACDPKHNKINFTGNRYLCKILSQQKQFCPLVRPGSRAKMFADQKCYDSCPPTLKKSRRYSDFLPSRKKGIPYYN